MKRTRQSLRGKVHGLNKSGKLALFVGAGISVGCGLPDWRDLIAQVASRIWKADSDLLDLIVHENQIISARHAKRVSKTHLNAIIADCLYDREITLSDNIVAIAECGIKKICTFNFDDLLEEAFLTLGIEVNVVLEGDPYDSLSDEAVVFHPHGIVERGSESQELGLAKLVISEDNYNDLYSNPYSWANVLLLSLLTNYSVVFVGMSLVDPNVRRLLDVIRGNGFSNQHFAILRDPCAGAPKEQRNHLKRVKKMKEMDLRHFRVTPWWVDDYSEIGRILRAIEVTRAT
jgi:hypothetical protein